MSRVLINGVELDYAVHGPSQGRPLLMLMGLGMQRIAWPEPLLDALAARGYCCLTLDNRDVGLSTRYRGQRPPGWGRLLLGRLGGRPPALAYSLADLADDARALLGHLGWAQADVVGISMGGMIAQHLAARHPDSVRSLSLLCSSSGRLGLPLPRWRVFRQTLRRPRSGQDAQQSEAYLVELLRRLAGAGYPADLDQVRQAAAAAVARAASGAGVERQFAAILADASRVGLLRRLAVPTLVLHGSDDPLLPPAHGRDLARSIPQARLQLIDGWGHDLPSALLPALAEAIDRHAQAAAASRAAQTPPPDRPAPGATEP